MAVQQDETAWMTVSGDAAKAAPAEPSTISVAMANTRFM